MILRRKMILIAIGLLSAGCALSVADPAIAQTHSILDRSAPDVLYEGFTEPRHTIMVAASEIGLLETVLVHVGDRVVAGQVIGKLDDAMQLSAVRIATLQSKMRGERDAAQAEVDMHQARTINLRDLSKDGMARPDELMRAETDLRVAMGRYAAAEEQFALRQLELHRYQLQLERRNIRVPMDGVISAVSRKPGEYISPGDPSIAELLVDDKLIAVFNVPVEDSSTIKIGTNVRVFLRSLSTTIDSVVTSIAPDIEGESGTIQVRVELDNGDGRLLAGDRCTLQILSSAQATASKSVERTRK